MPDKIVTTPPIAVILPKFSVVELITIALFLSVPTQFQNCFEMIKLSKVVPPSKTMPVICSTRQTCNIVAIIFVLISYFTNRLKCVSVINVLQHEMRKVGPRNSRTMSKPFIYRKPVLALHSSIGQSRGPDNRPFKIRCS